MSCSVPKHALPITRFSIIRPGDRTRMPCGSSASLLERVVSRVQVRGERVAAKVVGERLAERAHGGQLAAPFRHDLVLVRGVSAATGVAFLLSLFIVTLPASGTRR